MIDIHDFIKFEATLRKECMKEGKNYIHFNGQKLFIDGCTMTWISPRSDDLEKDICEGMGFITLSELEKITIEL